MSKSKSKKSKPVPAAARETAPLPALENELRLTLAEAFRALRISPAFGYRRIAAKKLRTQRDGRRTFVTREELKRYVNECNGNGSQS